MEAIRKNLYLNPNICKDKNNGYKLKVSSVISIKKVINFMEKAPLKLIGHKSYSMSYGLKNLAIFLDYIVK